MVVGKTNWQETSTTLNTLAQQNGIHIMSVEYFREPYSDTYHDILKQIVMRTRARTRGKSVCVCAVLSLGGETVHQNE